MADEGIGSGQFCGFSAFFVGGVQSAVADILQHGAGKEDGVLEDDAQGFAQGAFAHLVDVDAVIGDGAFGDVVETVQQVGDGGFAGSGGAYQGNFLSGEGGDVDVVEDGLCGVIGKVYVPEMDLASKGYVLVRAVLLGYLPGPVPGFGFAAFFRGHQGHVAMVFLGVFGHEAKDAFCTGHGQDDGVNLG